MTLKSLSRLLSSKIVGMDISNHILGVDVRYPKELHDLHNDLPFMCEKMKISGVPNLNDKNNYVVHIKVLNQAFKHGLILEKVHHMTEFNQSAWLKPYIGFNTQLRTQAKNDFETDFIKLMNNSVFGKTMENIRKHKDIKLIANRESFLKTVMKPNFKSAICFSENLVGYEMEKTKVTMNKPVYLGQAILDLSKLVMYEFHFDYMAPRYGENWKLCYMDTDSLIYHIKAKDFYSDISGNVKERLDTSGYDKADDRPLPIGINKKVIGLMKDELGGKIMKKFVTLRPKSYAYRKLDNKEDKKCKGIKKCIIKNTISFDDYKNCLLDVNSKSIYRPQLMFRNNKHEIPTVEVNKIALNRDDNKQIAKKDGISKLARGHNSL